MAQIKSEAAYRAALKRIDELLPLTGDDVPADDPNMLEMENPYKIHILEIYADKEAYQNHLQTAHFKKYKEGTAKMVKSLKLIDTNPLAGMKQWE